jgi:hypothetical protein
VLGLEAIPVTIVAAAISFLWAFVSGSRRSFGTFLTVSLATLANLLWLAWFFRDGMGPDAITTSGLDAWQHFWALAAVPVVAWVALALATGLRYWHAVHTCPNNSFKPKPLRGSA